MASAQPRRRLAPSVVLSALAHALLLAVAILWARRPIQAPEFIAPPSFDVIFDHGNAKRETVAVPNTKRETGTAPEAAPTPTPTAPPTTPPVPSPPIPVPAPVPPAPAAPLAPVSPPRVSVEIPPLPTVPIPAITAPVLPSPPATAAPRRTPAHRAFPVPMQFSLGGPPAPPVVRHRGGQGIAITFGGGLFGAEDTKVFGRTDSKEVGPDWYNQFEAWWVRHRYYPPQAGRNNQDGDVTLDLVIARDGRVEGVRLASGSGSQWLDLAALGVFRDAKLPALPSDAAPTVPLRLTIHYEIIRN